MEEIKPKGKVLLIDDDPDTVGLIGTLLEKEGYKVISALNGEQGLKKAYEENPDLVLIDIRLPDMDGNEVLRRIKDVNPDRSVIMVTAYADVDNAIAALKFGADDYVKKPFDNTYLVHTINRAYEAMLLKRERKMLKKRVTKLLKKKLKLTGKDKLVLYGLTQYPEMNDTSLSKKLGIPRTTVTGIKNKLRKREFYRRINIPDLAALGCELLSVSYLKFNPLGLVEERKKYIEKIFEQPELIYAQSTDTEEILVHVSKSYTDFKMDMDSISRMYRGNNYVESIDTYQFPFRLSRIPRFLDFAPLLHNLFDLKIGYKVREGSFGDKIYEPTNTEKLVLYALTRFPESSDTEIAERVSLSRARVSQIKGKLLDRGLIQSSIVPDLKKVGCELLAVEHVEIKKKVEMEIDPRVIFMALGDVEGIKISALEDYTEYRMIYERRARSYRKNLNMKEKTFLIPTENIKMSKLDFAPLVKKILGLDVGF